MHGAHSVLDPRGVQAARIADLFWFNTWIHAAIFVLVITALGYVVWRGHRRAVALEHEADPLLFRVIGGALAVTTVILFVLLVATVRTGRAVSELDAGDVMVVKVTGHQFWWEVEYESPTISARLVDANEIHIPVGRPVIVKGTSADVIHSFWVPSLHGKVDLIPTHVTSRWIEADHEGVFLGRCAEFCGMQHANMGLTVIAQPKAAFDDWYAKALQPAAMPTDAVRQRGHDVFVTQTCVMCHSIAGTSAFGRFGPDLTHIASRRTLAAGTLENTPGNLGGWLLDPQRIKPGNHMPMNALAAEDFTALLAYLEGLH
jgi:cytochrome c oxidase subunit 2